MLAAARTRLSGATNVGLGTRETGVAETGVAAADLREPHIGRPWEAFRRAGRRERAGRPL